MQSLSDLSIKFSLLWRELIEIAVTVSRQSTPPRGLRTWCVGVASAPGVPRQEAGLALEKRTLLLEAGQSSATWRRTVPRRGAGMVGVGGSVSPVLCRLEL